MEQLEKETKVLTHGSYLRIKVNSLSDAKCSNSSVVKRKWCHEK